MKTKLKRIIGVLLLTMQLAVLVPASMAESQPMEKRKLLVTAYYSPLPDQEFYIRGSYEADIRLNGRGTNGADGTEVYTGMLAAPKSYPFGTRVSIPGLGVGEVHDRGGAIYAHQDYDRIDVWMGRGEEGLARALNWGARLVEGEVYFTPHQVEPGLSFGWVSAQLPASAEARLRNRTIANSQTVTQPASVSTPVSDPVEKQIVAESEPETRKDVERLEEKKGLLSVGLGKDSSGEAVSQLQQMLWELGYYDGTLTGSYDDATMTAVYAFQLENDVVDSEWDAGAGYFGKKTKEAMLAVVDRKISVISDYPKEAQVWVPAKRVLPVIASLEAPSYEKERQELYFSEELMNTKVVQEITLGSELDLRDENEEVVNLQNILIKNGYLESGLNTGYFGQKTAQAVLQFQLDKGIVSSALDSGAGRVGPQTLSSLNSI